MSFSPDGRWIAYDVQPDSNSSVRDIALLATDASREIPLVQHPARDLAPIWTPDGKRVLFSSDRTGTFGLWAINVAAGKPEGSPELVKSNLGLIHSLGFTRDGSLYYALGWKEDVYTATLDLEAGRILSPPRPASPRFVGANSRPAWSPDGRYLAYRTSLGYLVEPPLLSIRSLDSGTVRELSPRLIRISDVQWSSRGRSLLVSGRDLKNREGAFRIDARTGAVIAFPGSARQLHAPAWSRDERTVFYVDDSHPGGYRIVARDLETGGEKEIHRGKGGASSLTLSPDNRQLAFSEREPTTGSVAINAMPSVGGAPRELCRMKTTDSGGVAYNMVRWTPDGRQLLFGWQRKQAADDLWRVPTAGGEPQRLGATMAQARHLSVHPDGRQISFHASVPDSGAGIWVIENFLGK
jgi:Tol biopolymer transport system component